MKETPSQTLDRVNRLRKVAREFIELREKNRPVVQGIVHRNGVRYVPVNGQVK
jgi:hypothetical protein